MNGAGDEKTHAEPSCGEQWPGVPCRGGDLGFTQMLTDKDPGPQPAPEKRQEPLHQSEQPKEPGQPEQQDKPEPHKTWKHVGGSAALSKMLGTREKRPLVAMGRANALGLEQSKVNPCVFRKVGNGKANVVLVIHVDNITAAGKTA